MQAHRQRQAECVITVMTFKTPPPPAGSLNLANGAVYILSADLLERMRKDLHSVQDFSTEVLHRFGGTIHTYETAPVFLDVGTPEA